MKEYFQEEKWLQRITNFADTLSHESAKLERPGENVSSSSDKTIGRELNL